MSQAAICKAVFPVAGLGTRLLPATRSLPKEMLPVGYRPVVQHLVDEMLEAGLNQFLFVSSRRKRAIEDYFDRDPNLPATPEESELKARIFYVRQSRPAGNGDAVRLAEEFVGAASFVVGFGDTLIRSEASPGVVGRLIESHLSNKSAATVAVVPVDAAETGRYGIVRPALLQSDSERDFAIDDIVEKPSPEVAPSNLAVAARYVFSPEIFAALRATPLGKGDELWLADAIRVLIQKGKRVRCLRLRSDERRYDIGTPITYFQAFADYALEDPEYGVAFGDYLRQRLDRK